MGSEMCIRDRFGKAAKEAQDGFMDDDLFATIRNNYEESMASTYSWMSMSDGVFDQSEISLKSKKSRNYKSGPPFVSARSF